MHDSPLIDSSRRLYQNYQSSFHRGWLLNIHACIDKEVVCFLHELWMMDQLLSNNKHCVCWRTCQILKNTSLKSFFSCFNLWETKRMKWIDESLNLFQLCYFSAFSREIIMFYWDLFASWTCFSTFFKKGDWSKCIFVYFRAEIIFEINEKKNTGSRFVDSFSITVIISRYL